MFYHWFHLLCLAREACDKANEIEAADANAMSHDALSSILFAALATEAFINELAEAAARDTHGDWMTGVPRVTEIRELADKLDAIERTHGSVNRKYRPASTILSEASCPRGRAGSRIRRPATVYAGQSGFGYHADVPRRCSSVGRAAVL